MGQAQCCQSESDASNLDMTQARKSNAKAVQEAEAVHCAETASIGMDSPKVITAAPKADTFRQTENSDQAAEGTDQKSVSFSVSFEQAASRGSFGAHVDPSDGKYLFISSLEAGDTVVSEYNRRVRANGGQEVEAGQYIVEINGKRGDARQLEALLATSTKISAVLAKPTPLECTVPRNGRPLGLELRYPCNFGTSLLVEAILPDGAAQTLSGWSRPQPNDRILAVNGRSGGVQSLLDEIKKSSDSVHLGMCRLVED